MQDHKKNVKNCAFHMREVGGSVMTLIHLSVTFSRIVQLWMRVVHPVSAALPSANLEQVRGRPLITSQP